MPDPEQLDPEEVEVVAHSDDDEDEELSACYYNSGNLE
jgi:hypothetical protein